MRLTYFWTWWTRSWMTKNQTLMSTIRPKIFLTGFSTRMGNNPRIKLGIRDFSTITSVLLRNFCFRVSSSTFWTTPFQVFFVVLVNPWDWSRQVHQIIVVKVPLLLKNAVLSPTLNTLKMKTAMTFCTIPNGVFTLQVPNAN